MSTIDLYQEILENTKANINAQQEILKKAKKQLDSIKKDSIQLTLSRLKKGDSLKIIKNLKKLELPKMSLEEMNLRQ